MFNYYLEMALQGKYKEEMAEYKKQKPIKTSITNKETLKEIQTYLQKNIDSDIKVRIFASDKTKTFDSYYEIDITPIYRNTEDHAALFKRAVSDIKKYLKDIHISTHAYKLFVKNIGFLDK